MEFSGLISKYRVNRKLEEQERMHQLEQKRSLNIEPHYQLSVISMNSTFLESVDKWYGWKGFLTGVSLAVILIFSWGFFGLLYTSLTSPIENRTLSNDWPLLLGVGVMVSPLIACAAWLLLKESFAYTHYPIRFNRKTRMIHVFRTNGTVLSVPWEKVFFTLGHVAQWNEWEVRGHVLDSDGVTVHETFALSYVGTLSAKDTALGCMQYSSEDFVRAHWEFIRRYMEEGPQAVSAQVQFCMPVNGRREGFWVGVKRAFANIAGAPLLIYWMMFPFCLVVGIVRWGAMRSCKVPQWPQDLDASCMVEPNDPYAIEGAPNGERMAVFPEAALAGGVSFRTPPRASTVKERPVAVRNRSE